jgi:O-antigen/teichoic acid export membrane protein
MKDRLIRLLRWSERYTKTDMVYLASGGFWLMLGQVAASASAFLLSIAYANLISKDVYGTYKYVLSIIGVLSALTLPGISTSYFRAVGRGEEGGFFDLFKTRLRWGLFASVASLGVAGYYVWGGNLQIAACFLIAAPFLPFMDPFAFYDSLLQGRRRFDLAIRYNLIEQGVAVVAVLLVLFFSPTLLALVAAYFIAWTCSRGAIFFYVARASPRTGPKDAGAASYGKHLSLMKWINTAAGSLGSILLFHLAGASGLAVYSFALAPVEQLRGLLSYAQNLITPKVARDSWRAGDARAFFGKIAPFVGAIALGVFIYIVLAQFFFRLVFPTYLDAVFYSRLMAPTLILSGVNFVLGAILQAKGEVRALHIVNIVVTGATLISSVAGVYYFDILGLALIGYVVKTVEFGTDCYFIFANRNASESSADPNGSSVPI